MSAITTHCPALTHLALRWMGPSGDPVDHDHTDRPMWREQAEVLAPLLAQVGPRLRQLELFSMAAWFPSVYQLLPSWTALESLSLRIASDYLVVPVVTQTGILSHVCQLTQLRSLSMELDCRYASVEDDMNDNAAVPVHDPSSLRHLISALTALARLDLDLPHY